MRILISIAIFFSFAFNAYSQSALEQMKSFVSEGSYEKAANLIPDAVAKEPKNLSLMIYAADIYLELNKYAEAVKLLEKAKDIDDTPDVLLKLGDALAYNGKLEEGLKFVNKAIKEDKNNAFYYMVLGNIYLRADSVQQAKLMFGRAREIDKKNPAPFIGLGDISFKQGVYELAYNNYKEALAINPRLLDARIKMAQCLYWLANREVDNDLRNQLYTDALTEWNNITLEDPKNARAWFEQGKIFFFAKQWKNAAVALNNFVALRPSGSLGRWYLAQSYYELRLFDSANIHLIVVEKEIDSVSKKAKLMSARSYYGMSQYAEANAKYKEIAAVEPLPVDDLRRQGQSALNSKDTTTAIAVWKDAINKDPENNCQLMYILGTSLNRMKRYDEAIEILTKRLTTNTCQDSLVSTVHYFIGLASFFSGKNDEAIKAFEASLATNPNNTWALVYLADVYAAKSDLAKSEETFLKAIQVAKTDKVKYKNELNQSYFKIAGMKLDAKKFGELEKITKAWIEDMPDSEFGNLFMGFALQGQNDVAGACKYYRQVLKINPENKNAKESVKKICGN